MEGYLKKWVNMVLRWQYRYFVLNDHILHYCESQNGKIKGQAHLKVSSIMLMPDDPLRIIINTGTTEMHLRASSVSEKIEWVNALKKSQDQCLDVQEQPTECLKQISDTLTDIWVGQALFDETLSLLLPKLNNIKSLHQLTRKLQEQGQKLKLDITQCTTLLQQEKDKIEMMQSEDVYPNDNQTVFQSFHDLSARQLSFENLSSIVSHTSTPIKSSPNLSLQEVLEQLKDDQPIKYKNIKDNPVFKKLKLTNARTRSILPRIQDPNEKLNIWNIIKDMIGKDITKFSVPVQLNEPLSMLQRLAESLEYYEMLIQANRQSDSCLGMCFVMAFAVSAYCSNINRHKKPFNPLLGETYEMKHKQFRFVSEQVSHHPPISAGFAESPDFEFWSQTDIISKFTTRCLEVKPQGNTHIILKANNDHISYSKCMTKVNNLIFGQMYLDHVGDMHFKNYRNGDVGVLTLYERSWSGKDAHRVSGTVKDIYGKLKYTVTGHWNEKLVAIDAESKVETQIWKANELPPDHSQYYYYTKFTMMLNHLNLDMIQSLPPTDSRLRPDQLALELGYQDLATDEKNRLEQKQRILRKQMQELGTEFQPEYFKQELEPMTNELIYKYRGNYWKRRNIQEKDIF